MSARARARANKHAGDNDDTVFANGFARAFRVDSRGPIARVVARTSPPTSKTTIKNAFIFHAGYAKKNIVPNKYNMGDFDICDKYVLLLNDLAKNPGVAISMKQFKNLDALIAVATFDFREFSRVELTEEQKDYLAATVSAGELYESLINENVPDDEVFHISFSDIGREYKMKIGCKCVVSRNSESIV